MENKIKKTASSTKMPKVKRIRGDKVTRSGSLAHQIEGDSVAKTTGRQKTRKRRDKEDEVISSIFQFLET